LITDSCSRFIICCPEEEHESFDRLFFQIEEAHWFYMDFYREKHPKLPSLNFKQFAEIIFSHCPLLQQYKGLVHEFRSEWIQYKTSVPVCGAIILNQTMDRALLVRGIGTSASWSFPRGKINKDEPSATCAVREVREETGLDISRLIQEKESIEITFNEQTVKLFIVVMDVHESEVLLAPQTRGEIGAIDWLHLEEDILRSGGNDKKKKRFWTVVPFVRQVKTWISKRRATMTLVNNNKPIYSPAKQRTPKKEKLSKRSGKNNSKRIIDSEIDYQIPLPRSAPKSKSSSVGKSQPITILRRGDSLPDASITKDLPVADTVSGSYSPPSLWESPQYNFPWTQQQYMTVPHQHVMSDSFLNFSFNADEIVGDFTFVV
jgi:mRNA-decapping enzyme subunit 2